ncbi:MAG: hypothetical protein KDD25_08545, partial [Bdellovibrionales bacterium]|nr:hypothetical protein [Bdellovibrionales bacterium]
QKIILIKGLISTLGDIDQLHSLVQNFAMYETAIEDRKSGQDQKNNFVGSFENIRRSENHVLNEIWLAPLRSLGQKGFAVLDSLNHPIAREIIVEAGSAIYGSGLPLLSGSPARSSHSYFREWLNQLRAQSALVDKLPDNYDFGALEGLELRISSHSGGLFENMKVSGEMSSLSSIAKRPIYFRVRDNSERLPTYLFGMPGDKQPFKRELIQYIIEADKNAEKLATWSREATKARESGRPGFDRSYSVEGDDKLFSLIVSLPYMPSIARYAVVGFSEVEYQFNIIDLLQKLLEISSTSIVNTGTYVSILEASLTVIQNVEREYGLTSGDQPQLAAAAVRLQRTVHHKMMTGLSWMSHKGENSNACAILLSPNPWQTMRGK